MPMSIEGEDQHRLIDEIVTLDNLTELHKHVLHLAAHAGLPAQRAEEFAIAVNEAVTNAIQHAGGSGELTVLQDDKRRLIAEVNDAGPGMPCCVTITLPPPDAFSGRGLYLAEELADQVEVDRGPAGTTVRLEMSIPSQ